MKKMFDRNARGFTLIATLLLLLLLTGLGLGLVMMTNTETKVGGNDMENVLAYHAAEAGMEKMTVDLANLYTEQSPVCNQITALSSNAPTMANISFDQYQLTLSCDSNGKPLGKVDNITQGQNAGLVALITPITLQVAASRSSGMSVNMIRTVEVAQIPAFQFGVFSDSDLSYYPGPHFSFAGRVHTNGNLFLATEASDGLVFHSKLDAVGEVVRDYLSNGFYASSVYNGPVYIPNAANGCDSGTPPTSTCINDSNQSSPPMGSVYGGLPGNGAQLNPSWYNISTGTFKSYIINHLTGAKALTLPFAGAGAGAIEVLRKPLAVNDPTSVGQAREYNRASIRILLADTQALLHPERNFTDADDVQLVNNGSQVVTAGGTIIWSNATHTTGPIANVSQTPANSNSFFAEANQDCALAALNGNKWCEPNDQYRPIFNGTAVTGNQWSLLAADQTDVNKGAWLRVEYLDRNTNTWQGVTREWLSLGFARGPNPPQALGANAVHPNAILILQQQADRDGVNGVVAPGTAEVNTYGAYRTTTVNPPPVNIVDEAAGTITDTIAGGGTSTKYVWYPINLYDAREGEVRDSTNNGGTPAADGTKTVAPNSNCAPNGVMNLVELDVGNLKKWLTNAYAPAIPGLRGQNVAYQSENGYVLYFSDRRGMVADPNPANGSIYPAGVLTGAYGFEDTINSGSNIGMPNGTLEPANPGSNPPLSPEDVDGKGTSKGIDTWGVVTLMDGYVGTNNAGKNIYLGNGNATNWTRSNPKDPYTHRFNCMQVGRKNLTAGARHGLRLVDGALGNVPVRPDNQQGGFTVATENPLYVLGNYNANNAWTEPDAAAGVLADSVKLLSTSWSDLNSFIYPFLEGNRNATTTWYRMAIAGGKTISFPRPSTAYSQDFGTDGGLHNFLGYLEDWGSGPTLHYKGSLVSLYWSQYATGTFKCCDTVYSPPTRDYSFDLLFLNPANLPPGTPMFEDIDSLSYRQDFTAR